MIQLDPVDRNRLQASIADQQTVLDLEKLFLAVMELQGYMARPGDIVYFAGTTRANAVLADGASYLRVGTYAALFAAIGTTYGAADADHFNVPNIAGRVIAGKEAVAALITTGVSGFSGATLGAVGGSQSHTLITAEMPAHTHPQQAQTMLSQAGTAIEFSGAGTVAVGGTTQSTGGGGAHRNMQPTIILNAFILY